MVPFGVILTQLSSERTKFYSRFFVASVFKNPNVLPLKVKHVHLKLNEFKMIFFCQKSSYSILKMYGSALKHQFNSVPGSDCNECILTIDFFAVCLRLNGCLSSRSCWRLNSFDCVLFLLYLTPDQQVTSFAGLCCWNSTFFCNSVDSYQQANC